MTYLAATLALPYGIVRAAWGLGIPLGTPDLDWIYAWRIRLGLVVIFGGLPVCGALLTIGLVRPWGEVFPSWIPRIGGRSVPLWLAVVPGGAAAIMIIQFGLRVTPGSIASLPAMTWDTWGSSGPAIFILPWGVTLALAVFSYAAHRLYDSRNDQRSGPDWSPTSHRHRLRRYTGW